MLTHTLSFPPALSFISHSPNTFSSFNFLFTYSSAYQTVSCLWHGVRFKWFCMSVEIGDYVPGKYLGAEKLHQTCSRITTILHSKELCCHLQQDRSGLLPSFSFSFWTETRAGRYSSAPCGWGPLPWPHVRITCSNPSSFKEGSTDSVPLPHPFLS